MAEESGTIEYHEVREYSLLEQCLRDRRASVPFVTMLVASILGISLALFHLFAAGFGTPESHSFRSTHLTVMLLLAIMFKPLFRVSIRDKLIVAGSPDNTRRIIGFVVDMVLLALVIFVESYVLYDVEAFQAREGDISQMDM